MKIFVIYRYSEASEVFKFISKIRKHLPSNVKFTHLSKLIKGWKFFAKRRIQNSEIVLVFNRELCMESENAKWEIVKSQEGNKITWDVDSSTTCKEVAEKITHIYDYTSEFTDCFEETCEHDFDLYKIIVDSSEKLIERRQKTNAFFITIIGSFVAIGGLLHKSGILTSQNYITTGLYSILAMLLCNSWFNLIDNYGKLNTAKFRVISQLEAFWGRKIYSAEWIALGQGNRKEKYRSFTNTEKRVPQITATIFLILTLLVDYSHIINHLK